MTTFLQLGVCTIKQFARILQTLISIYRYQILLFFFSIDFKYNQLKTKWFFFVCDLVYPCEKQHQERVRGYPHGSYYGCM